MRGNVDDCNYRGTAETRKQLGKIRHARLVSARNVCGDRAVNPRHTRHNNSRSRSPFSNGGGHVDCSARLSRLCCPKGCVNDRTTEVVRERARLLLLLAYTITGTKRGYATRRLKPVSGRRRTPVDRADSRAYERLGLQYTRAHATPYDVFRQTGRVVVVRANYRLSLKTRRDDNDLLAPEPIIYTDRTTTKRGRTFLHVRSRKQSGCRV